MASGIVSAACSFLLLHAWGKAGDCAPGEIDGQCGMSAAAGDLFGIVVASVIVIVFAVWSAAIWSGKGRS